MANDQSGPASGSLVRTATIRNRLGMHARAAVKVVKLLEEFEAEMMVRNGDMTVSARSIMGLMMLAAAPGTALELVASGRQAAGALSALAALIERGFDEN
jgi:phosphocarrier protein